MAVLSNIIIDQGMQVKIDTNALNISDHLIISLANIAAELFPLATVYVGAQQQAVDLPAIFVDYYSISNQQKLATTSNYEFGFAITYIPIDRLSSSELNGAVFTLLQGLFRVPTDIGEFGCYSKNSDITDGLANVTGLISIGEQDSAVDPIIKSKELNI